MVKIFCLLSSVVVFSISAIYGQNNLSDNGSLIPQFNYPSQFSSPISMGTNQMYTPSPYSNEKQKVILDNVIDSLTYKVGPGDVFAVYIWSSDKKQFNIEITTEGNVLLPSIGNVDVKSLNLTDAKSKIRNKVCEVYKNVNVSITLTQLRSFKTYIYGEIGKKGSYIVNGNTRVSDIITLAGGINVNGKHRGIIIYNDLTKDSTIVDLSLTENVSNFQKNPYITEGDRIFVPPRKETVYINGNIHYPGTYDFLENDRISNLITIAGGFSRGADTNKILLYQYKDNRDSLTVIQIKNSDIDTFKLNPDDRIIVCPLPKYRYYRRVFIKGEVNCPGEYPIRKDKTLLSEVIAMAGGLTEFSDLKRGKLIRSKYQFPGEREFDLLKKIPLEKQSPYEKSYFLTKSTEDTLTVNIPFEKIIKENPKNSDLILEDGDIIIIPEKTSSVKIIGGVIHPGLVKYEKDKSYREYIKESGGFNSRAKRTSITIIKNVTEQFISPDNTEIEAGDVIWIPEKRYVNKLETVKDWLVIVGTVATTLLAIFAIQDKLK